VRSRYVLPIVFAFAIMGSYSIDGTTSGPSIMFIFTLIGAAVIRYKYPAGCRRSHGHHGTVARDHRAIESDASRGARKRGRSA
jgi:hypothetical protein